MSARLGSVRIEQEEILSRLELFFDCGSPWTYLAFHGLEALAAETGTELELRPVLVGGIFNAINESVYAARADPVPQKWAYHQKDLQDWAQYRGLEIRWPETFPINSVKAMRGCLVALDQGCGPAYARAVFEAYWRDSKDIASLEVLSDCARRVGLDAAVLAEGVESDPIKARLRANTEEVIARGGFGSPMIFLNETDLFFGQDRLELIRARLQAERD